MRTSSRRRSILIGIYGFTLIELLVTIVIISILGALSLAGLAGTRQRSKVDKTKSTIRKLHEIIVPQYESYLTRRLAVSAGMTNRIDAAKARLTKTRALMVLEMPDQWSDVDSDIVPMTLTAPARRYAIYKTGVSSIPSVSTIYNGAECLYMIVTRGGFAADSAEMFRTDEIIDINKNNAPEFADGWGRPIGYIRWPAGFSSPTQQLNAKINPDPFDPMNVSGIGPANPDYKLTPLIFSAGPDEAVNDPISGSNGYGIQVYGPWLKPTFETDLLTTRVGSPLVGSISDSSAASDNITNHDLLTK
jgi:prepilin-type N-terminal cleavage/methylation domain-containing protein